MKSILTLPAFLLFLFSSILSNAQITTSSQWTWMKGDSTADGPGLYGTKGVGSAINKPAPRFGHVTWTDNNGNLWLFGGIKTFSGTSLLNDLWKYSPSLNEWTWVSGDSTVNQLGVYGTKGVADAANKPGSRFMSVSWTDADNNLWLFGGGEADFGGFKFNDLWKYSPTLNMWTWVSGDNTTNQPGVYGVQGVASAANKPGARNNAVSWTDANNKLWLFGGNFSSPFNDLWKYDPVTNQWTWMKGSSSSGNIDGVYGTIGTPNAANNPGARIGSTSWTDDIGNLWLFGGKLTSGEFFFNDLWKYDPLTNTWTWVTGSNTTNKQGVYGIRGTPSASNMPGTRYGSIKWKDGFGNLWLFGGWGYDAVNVNPLLNDLWRYNVASNQWTWINGSNSGYQQGLYGMMGVPNAANRPGGKFRSGSWTDASGNFWLFGGNGSGNFNDLWKLSNVTAAPNPNLIINDVNLNEGNSGTTTYSFTVSLSAPAPVSGVTFNIATADGTTTAGNDYIAKSLTGQTIPAGSSTYTFEVLVNGDLLFEPNETFLVNVTNVIGAIITDGQGLSTIINDDVDPCTTDNTPPVVVSKNITISLDATGHATIQPADVIQSVTDNCTVDNSSFTVTPNSFSCSGTSVDSGNHQAYIAGITAGNQSWQGELGMEFKVNNTAGIVVKQLGAFDHLSDGITGTQSGGIRVAIFNKATQTIVPGLDAIIIGNADHYTGNHRMRDITPVTLMPGEYVIVSKGYNINELNGNDGLAGGIIASGDSGNGAINYTGTSLYGNQDPATFTYPPVVDDGPANRYLAGTFIYDLPGNSTISSDHQAYTVNTTTGNQSWQGELGMEFKVNNTAGIVVKQLGAFDHEGNGITGTQSGGIRVAIFNKTTQSIVPGLDAIIVGNADHYTGNHRMKDITPVTLMPGDYAIVSKGYNANELNGNSGFTGVPYAFGDSGNAAIKYVGTSLYGNEDSATFVYPPVVDDGPANRYLAGTFLFDVLGTVTGGPGNNTVTISVKDINGNIGYATAIVSVLDANNVCNSSPVIAYKSGSKATERTGIAVNEQKGNAENLLVYPNPTTGSFSVQLPNFKTSKATIEIYNTNGVLIEKKSINLISKTESQTVRLSLLNKPSGVYCIKVTSAETVKTAKVVLQR